MREILKTLSGRKYENTKIFRLRKYLQTQARPCPVKVILPTESEAKNRLKLFSSQKKIVKLSPLIA